MNFKYRWQNMASTQPTRLKRSTETVISLSLFHLYITPPPPLRPKLWIKKLFESRREGRTYLCIDESCDKSANETSLCTFLSDGIRTAAYDVDSFFIRFILSRSSGKDQPVVRATSGIHIVSVVVRTASGHRSHGWHLNTTSVKLYWDLRPWVYQWMGLGWLC